MIALLLHKKVDVVMRLHQGRKASACRQTWKKLPLRETWDKALWDELPGEIVVRIVRFRIDVPGFRTDHVVLATTLLDAQAYPDEQIAALWARRWSVELFFRDIKISLGLDLLRCLSPELVEKEVWLHAIDSGQVT